MTSNIDSSGISFTAHYTGEVWKQHGLSEPFLSTQTGQRLYRAGRPLEILSRILFGFNNEIQLLQRHHIIDSIVENAINKQGVSQIVEIACGLSPRGVMLRKKFPQLHYIEADLPAMAEKKRAILTKENLLGEKHQVIDCNILATEGDETLENLFTKLDTSKPVLVITEGLVNYFELNTISVFWQRLVKLLGKFPAGHYVTDNYPLLAWHPSARWTQRAKRALARITKADVAFHFDNDQQIVDGFLSYGFAKVNVLLPESFYGVLTIPVQRTPSIVRVVHAQTT